MDKEEGKQQKQVDINNNEQQMEEPSLLRLQRDKLVDVVHTLASCIETLRKDRDSALLLVKQLAKGEIEVHIEESDDGEDNDEDDEEDNGGIFGIAGRIVQSTLPPQKAPTNAPRRRGRPRKGGRF